MKFALCCVLFVFVVGLCQASPTFLTDMLSDKDSGSIWALLVAGSNTWMNYRHQADICHAYQVLHSHGVPDDHIVVMMYDDIANNEDNPTPGVIINHKNGTNVYPGVPHDYTKEDVNPKHFLNILTGHNMTGIGSGKTINSGPDDFLFVYFADHGSTGVIAFPEQMLTAKRWNNAIQRMHDQKKYKQMVIYLEACESGSMFDGILPNDINVYVTTAANPTESSYACYFDSHLMTYLGDCYSVNWMEDVDKVGTNESLKSQYKKVKAKTTTSHVMQYGDKDLNSEMLGKFMGSENSDIEIPPVMSEPTMNDAVPSGDVPLSILAHQIFNTESEWDKRVYEERLIEELQLRAGVRQTMETIVNRLVGSENVDSILHKKSIPRDFDCLETVLERFSSQCFNVPKVDYAMRHVYILVNLCEYAISPEKIMESIDDTCGL